MTVTIPFDVTLGSQWLKQIQANFDAVAAAELIALASEAETITGESEVKGVTPAGFAAGFAAAFATARALEMVNKPMDAVMVVGAQAGTTINVTVQLNNSADDPIAAVAGLKAYLSDNADGSSIAGTAPDGDVAIGTDGLLIPLIAGKAFELISESDGDIDLDIVESGNDTWYLVIILPDGNLVVSDAITFAT